MTLTTNLKAKKRAKTCRDSSPLTAPDNEPPHPTKRVRRPAETKQCPVCDEHIPVRLLSRHAELESERLDALFSQLGTQPPDSLDYDDFLDNEPGPSSRVRRSAIKARKSMTTSARTVRTVKNTLDQTAKTIQTVKRNRKARQGKLREIAKEEQEGAVDPWATTGEEVVCPICSVTVRGDQDVVEAHVDACIAHEARRAEEVQQWEVLRQQAALDEWNEDDAESLGNYVGNLRGAGFHTRNTGQEDVDDEVDIDGDDEAAFGLPQFTEGDIVPVVQRQEDEDIDESMDVDIENDEDEAHEGQKSLQDLIAAQTVPDKKLEHAIDSDDQLNQQISSARRRADKNALIIALDRKIKHLESVQPSSVAAGCRICLDPYNEPTVSTGCWHTCCSACWLRCLGSTKLCPICKRITGATELRRIYL